jgi:PAS domain-containing protein
VVVSFGRYRWFASRYNPVLDEQGRIERWYARAFDIEDRKRAEAQVEEAYLRLAGAQRLSKTGSFITDLLVDEQNWSEEARRIFEFDPATKVTVQTFRDKIHPEDLPSIDAVLARHGGHGCRKGGIPAMESVSPIEARRHSRKTGT